MHLYLINFLLIASGLYLSANESAAEYHAKDTMGSRLDSLNGRIDLTQSSYESIIQQEHPWISKTCNALYYRKNKAEKIREDAEVLDARFTANSGHWPHLFWYDSQHSPLPSPKDKSLLKAQLSWEAQSLRLLSISEDISVKNSRVDQHKTIHSSRVGMIYNQEYLNGYLSRTPVLLSQEEAILLALHAEKKLGITLPSGNSVITMVAKKWDTSSEYYNTNKPTRSWESASYSYSHSDYFLKLTHHSGTNRNEFLIDWQTKKLLIVQSYSTNQ